MIQYFWDRLKKAWNLLLHENATPGQIGAGFAIGLFATFFPIPVLDTLVAMVIAWVARANKASCLVANNMILIVFPLIPVLLGLEYLTGNAVLSLSTSTPLPSQTLTDLLHSPLPIVKSIVLGGLLLGVPTSIVSYFLVKKAAVAWQKSKIAT